MRVHVVFDAERAKSGCDFRLSFLRRRACELGEARTLLSAWISRVSWWGLPEGSRFGTVLTNESARRLRRAGLSRSAGLPTATPLSTERNSTITSRLAIRDSPDQRIGSPFEAGRTVMKRGPYHCNAPQHRAKLDNQRRWSRLKKVAPYCTGPLSASGMGKGMTEMPSSSRSRVCSGVAWPRMPRSSLSP